MTSVLFILLHDTNPTSPRLVAGSRVIMPTDGFQNQEKPPTTIKLQNGTELTADLVIPAVGQTPNNQFLSSLPLTSPDSLINPANGFIRVRPTLQFRDPQYPHLYAVGDIADSGAHKAARPGVGQAQAVAKNVLAMVEGLLPDENVVVGPAAIHLTLGLVSFLCFFLPRLAYLLIRLLDPLLTLLGFEKRQKMSSSKIRIRRVARLNRRLCIRTSKW